MRIFAQTVSAAREDGIAFGTSDPMTTGIDALRKVQFEIDGLANGRFREARFAVRTRSQLDGYELGIVRRPGSPNQLIDGDVLPFDLALRMDRGLKLLTGAKKTVSLRK
jgi:hypothetical protein